MTIYDVVYRTARRMGFSDAVSRIVALTPRFYLDAAGHLRVKL